MPSDFDPADIFGNIENKQKKRKTEPVSLTRINKFLSESPESHPWLVDGVLGVGSTSLLCSAPKVGKTTLLYSLSHSICSGRDWLGKSTIKSRCIVLFLEDRRDEVRRRYQALGINDTDELFIYCGRAPKNPVQWLRRLIEEYKPGILIADTWLRLFGSLVRDINCYNETTSVFDDLIELARTTGVHLMFTHHLGKKGFGTGSILGSTGLFSSVDTAILIQKIRTRRVIQSIQRYGEDMPEQDLLLNSETMMVSLGSSSDRISGEISLCLKAGAPLTEPEVMARVSGDTGAKRKILRDMVTRGLAKRLGTGTKGSPYFYET